MNFNLSTSNTAFGEAASPVPVSAKPQSDPVEAEALPQDQGEGQPAGETDDDETAFFSELEAVGRLAAIMRRREEYYEIYLAAKAESDRAREEYDSLASETADAKSDWEETVEQVVEIAEELALLTKGKKLPVSTDENDGSLSDPDGWRHMLTGKLLKRLDGLGSTKLEKITEQYPTAGDLEDLRGDAVRQHKPFYKVLPKGCGQKLASKIEDRLIDHIGKWGNVQVPASQQVEPRVDPSMSTNAPDAEHVKKCDELLLEIQQVASSNEWSEKFCQLHDDSLEQPLQKRGHQAFEDGMAHWSFVPPEENPLDLRDFIIGYVRAERLQKLQSESPDPEPAQDPVDSKTPFDVSADEEYEDIDDDDDEDAADQLKNDENDLVAQL